MEAALGGELFERIVYHRYQARLPAQTDAKAHG
jgi:hypothetical protein